MPFRIKRQSDGLIIPSPSVGCWWAPHAIHALQQGWCITAPLADLVSGRGRDFGPWSAAATLRGRPTTLRLPSGCAALPIHRTRQGPRAARPVVQATRQPRAWSLPSQTARRRPLVIATAMPIAWWAGRGLRRRGVCVLHVPGSRHDGYGWIPG